MGSATHFSESGTCTLKANVAELTTQSCLNQQARRTDDGLEFQCSLILTTLQIHVTMSTT